jgi:uncharacterized SAM-binding protein YcdF (DUF218 family)
MQNMASIGDKKTPSIPSDGLRRLWAWPITMSLISVGVISLAGAGFGRQGIEKSMTALVMPVGFFWLLLTTWMLLSWLQHRKTERLAATALWALFTLMSTGPVPNFWINQIESRTLPYQPQSELPLDYVVVLGGGTSDGPNRSQVSGSGDRVVLAAQLYLQGHCKHLITTGTSAKMLGIQPESGPTEQTREIWTGLRIPASAISSLPGSNTFEEMQSLKSMLAGKGSVRVGLLTSASHLPRALRLAREAGINDLIPIPANHRGGDYRRSLFYYLPSANHLQKFADCQHEWMGSLIGR